MKFGKFKDATSLLNSYDNLQKEFTKKCQELNELKRKFEGVKEDAEKTSATIKTGELLNLENAVGVVAESASTANSVSFEEKLKACGKSAEVVLESCENVDRDSEILKDKVCGDVVGIVGDDVAGGESVLGFAGHGLRRVNDIEFGFGKKVDVNLKQVEDFGVVFENKESALARDENLVEVVENSEDIALVNLLSENGVEGVGVNEKTDEHNDLLVNNGMEMNINKNVNQNVNQKLNQNKTDEAEIKENLTENSLKENSEQIMAGAEKEGKTDESMHIEAVKSKFKSEEWKREVNKFFSENPEAVAYKRAIGRILTENTDLALTKNCLSLALRIAKSEPASRLLDKASEPLTDSAPKEKTVSELFAELRERKAKTPKFVGGTSFAVDRPNAKIKTFEDAGRYVIKHYLTSLN